MRGRRHFRFCLSSLMVIVSLAALGLGYLRYTRSVLTATCRELEEAGVDVTFQEVGPQWLRRIIDSDFWLRKPVGAQLTLVQVGVAEFNVAGHNLGPGETQQAIIGIADRLRRMGMKEMSFEVMPAPEYWRDPQGTEAADRERHFAGVRQKRRLELFAAAHGFASQSSVVVLSGGPGRMAAPAATGPIKN
jgi:hypothetical protein